MMDAHAAEIRPTWFQEKLLLGMSWSNYLKTLLTPFNAVMAVILLIGVPKTNIFKSCCKAGSTQHIRFL